MTVVGSQAFAAAPQLARTVLYSAGMKVIGTEVGFAFTLHRVSLSDPAQHRSGRGIVVKNDDYSVWPAPGYAVRVTDSPDYKVGEIVHVSSLSLRP